jgi:ribA/ribD-fused uncharacterized protein
MAVEALEGSGMTITSFSGENRFLSNFWPSIVMMDGQPFPSVEHAYQAAKTTDKTQRRVIQYAPTAGKAKRLGKKVTMRPDWEAVRLQIMEELLREKFKEGILLKKLQATKPHKLIEGNTWGDQFWGESPLGTGQNHLGLLLMQIRDDVKLIF